MTESSGETMICDGCRLCVCVCGVGSLCSGVVLFGPVSPGSWPGSLASVAGLALVLLVFCWFLVIQDLNLIFRLTVSPCKTGFAQIHEDG